MYSAVEVFAALFAILGLTKIVAVVVNRKRWRYKGISASHVNRKSL